MLKPVKNPVARTEIVGDLNLLETNDSFLKSRPSSAIL
jgi:hypothetical protein